jgi:hypothetical protein
MQSSNGRGGVRADIGVQRRSIELSHVPAPTVLLLVVVIIAAAASTTVGEGRRVVVDGRIQSGADSRLPRDAGGGGRGGGRANDAPPSSVVVSIFPPP